MLAEFRSRADSLSRAIENEHPEQVLSRACELREDIRAVRSEHDATRNAPSTDSMSPEEFRWALEDELDSLERLIERLEGAGYRADGATYDFSSGVGLSTRAKLTALAIVLVLIGLAVWGVRALVQASDEENARMPGRVTGTVSLDGKKGATRVPYESVRLVGETREARDLVTSLTAQNDRQHAFEALRDQRATLPAVAEATLNPVGEFTLDRVPPGRYYLIVVTSKNESLGGAWMEPVTVEPTKISDVTLTEENRLK